MIRGKEGVTLLEVMVVVVIVGILAAVAIPSYNDYITRSRRSDAFTALETVRAAQEMYRAERGFYAKAFFAGATNVLPGCSAGMAGGNYNLVLTGRDTSAPPDNLWDEYEITATAQAKQAGDFDFRIDQNGVHWFDGHGGMSWRSTPTPTKGTKWEDLKKPPANDA